MIKAGDMTGQKLGRLTVIERVENKGRHAAWKCLCECGNTTEVRGGNLRSNHTTSCGCLHREVTGKRSTTHGNANTPGYGTWRMMRDRCYNPKNKRYYRYGGRGITVCERWLDSFENFLEDMGPNPSADMSIDRIDNEGNYSPDNCRWATAREQNGNSSRNRLLGFNGKRQCLSVWARESGVNYGTLWSRLNRGWSIEKALMTPC